MANVSLVPDHDVADVGGPLQDRVAQFNPEPVRVGMAGLRFAHVGHVGLLLCDGCRLYTSDA
jgi:hypothetical protein